MEIGVLVFAFAAAAGLAALAWIRRDRALVFELPAMPMIDALFFAEPVRTNTLRADDPIEFETPPDRMINQDYFNDSTQFGHFGEMITAVVLAADGWTQVPSHTPGARGLDHIFIREASARRYSVRLVESKITGADSDSYADMEMADESVLSRLSKLTELDSSYNSIASAIREALGRKSIFVRKELWEHDSRRFKADVHRLGIGGERAERLVGPTDKSKDDQVSYERLVRSIAISMKTFHRGPRPSDKTGGGSLPLPDSQIAA